ncbi:MAG: polysaccharide deacetylase family protein [Elusimicrobiota bacterium]
MTVWLFLLIGAGVLGVSLRWNWWRWPKNGIPVLMYHKIGASAPGSRQKSLWVSAERFEWQMKYLAERGYESVTFKDLSSGCLPPKPVMITFDDGYLNQYETAFPIMRRWGQRGVFYVVANGVGRENYWHNPVEEPRIPMMNSDQIKELVRAGMEIGSHTSNHHRLGGLSREEARLEIEDSKKRLEELTGEPMVSFAFPYGNGEDDPGLVEAVFGAGHRWVIGIHAGIWDHRRLRRVVPRVFVRGDDFKIDFYLGLTRGRSRF